MTDILRVTDLEAHGFPAPNNVFFDGLGCSWDDVIEGAPITHGFIENGVETDLRIEKPEILILHGGFLRIHQSPRFSRLTGSDIIPFSEHESTDKQHIINLPVDEDMRLRTTEYTEPGHGWGPVIYTCIFPELAAGAGADIRSVINAVLDEKIRHGNIDPITMLGRIHSFIDRPK